jgi:16S rRNA C967 or C1407 C5-methylase (RsmB/RsmF family)
LYLQPTSFVIRLTKLYLYDRFLAFADVWRFVVFICNPFLGIVVVCFRRCNFTVWGVILYLRFGLGHFFHPVSVVVCSGRVVAVDRTKLKVKKIQETVKRFGLTNVHTVVADSVGLGRDFEGGGFDRIMLDPTCSALGLRPRLSFAGITPDYLQEISTYQRRLIRSAVGLLKKGGTLVYSTCTVNPAENEGNVAWTLSKFKQMELVELGLPKELCPPGLPICGLGEDDAKKVARFEGLDGNPHDAFTGFFIAKMVCTE